jgi:hypothetical protein
VAQSVALSWDGGGDVNDGDRQPAPEHDAELRPPRGLGETLAANFRPQPAIPALFVLLLTIFVPVLSHQPGAAAGAGWALTVLVPLGILASCGLAIAAGFCSLFPQLAWIAVALWALQFTDGGPLPSYNRYVLIVGMVAAAAMIVLQVWRVRTGKFVPTIRVER